jgi:O-methyltransferase involved in polyketide biosynthesis
MPHFMRHDGYGNPLPELAEARKAVLYERPVNAQQRRVILQLLEEQWRDMLRKGINGNVTLTFYVWDGLLQPDVALTKTQVYRSVKEESDAPR